MIARMDFGRAAPKSIQDRRSGSGSLAMLAAIRRASSRVRSLAAELVYPRGSAREGATSPLPGAFSRQRLR